MADFIELPWPSKELSPNARCHWAVKARAVSAYRKKCYLLAKMAGMAAPSTGKLMLQIEFVPPTRRGVDDDNALAAFKAGRDGLADALRIDDRRFVTQISVSETPIKGGLVRCRVLAADGINGGEE